MHQTIGRLTRAIITRNVIKPGFELEIEIENTNTLMTERGMVKNTYNGKLAQINITTNTCGYQSVCFKVL